MVAASAQELAPALAPVKAPALALEGAVVPAAAYFEWAVV
jgi:hypothetical protein